MGGKNIKSIEAKPDTDFNTYNESTYKS